MSRSARALAAIVGVLACLALGAVPAGADRDPQESPEKAVILAILVPTEAAAYIQEGNAATGLGVYPESRSAEDFVTAIARGPAGATPLPERIIAAGGGVRVTRSPGAPGDRERRIAAAFVPEQSTPTAGSAAATLSVIVSDDAASLPFPGTPGVIIISLVDRTPVPVAITGDTGVLDGGIARRRGIVTPYDLAASIVQRLDLPTAARTITGEPLRADPARGGDLDALRARLVRDQAYGPGLAITTTVFAVGSVILGSIALFLRRRGIAAAIARAACVVPLGYLAAIFLPSARWQVRSIALVLAMAVAAGRRTRDNRRWCATMMDATVIAILVLTIAAALRPDAEPALSLWGNPLNSWRFFGLRNHLVAFFAGAVLVGTALRARPLWQLALATACAGIVVGAPSLGANYIGILTLVFGAGVAIIGRARGRIRWGHLIPAGLAGVAATITALLADAGTPVSHGGRAVASIRRSGVDAAFQIARNRARLNWQEIVDVGPIAYVGFVGAAVCLVLLYRWARRRADLTLGAGVAGAAVASFAALFVEDSGFFTGGIMALFPWLGFMAASLIARPDPDPIVAEQPAPA